ncbi:ATP-binding protein [Pseudotenacibaculum haliotis]|uniref:ATP-binding protein n=1 Tax=Pseudotenacibaculum haliotis TaxID=1862138 RepID=A0ABW5LUA6_9FLAO
MKPTPIINIQQTPSILPLLAYLESIIKHRLSLEFGQEISLVSEPELEHNQSHLAAFIKEEQLYKEDIILLLLALVPELHPGFLSGIISDYLPNGGEFAEFGGIKGKNHRGIIPTGETFLYILYGNDPEARLQGIDFIQSHSQLIKHRYLSLESVAKGEPKMSGRLVLDEECLARVTLGKIIKPQLSQNFPASLIETNLDWDDLILKPKTMDEIKEIEVWLQHNQTLLNDWNMKGIIKPGYRVMFYGAPGTGKTLTASLLGKYTNKDVYRIDLSMVVSKYIGETEKNLSSLFDKAINKDWILFFDEADSIFGKRTNVRDAHDKYANQEVSYLLQRIEAHPGLVILASNLKNNIDTAFTRRFQSIIEFEIPTHTERLRLWKNNLPKKIPLEKSLSLEELSRKYSITGANIVNIIQYACLKTLADDEKEIKEKHLVEGIRKEYIKEGKTL